jgi:GNAT superfamily N-acetyltransferase
MTNSIHIIDRTPTVDEHRALFEAVGWKLYAPEAAERALQNSLFGVVAFDGETLIGMGRIVGDGGKFFYIQDFAVLPAYQGQGVGKQMMARLMDYIKANAPHEPFVGLFATGVAIPFYQQFGFEPHLDALTGMWTVLPVDNTVPRLATREPDA